MVAEDEDEDVVVVVAEDEDEVVVEQAQAQAQRRRRRGRKVGDWGRGPTVCWREEQIWTARHTVLWRVWHYEEQDCRC